MALIPVKAVKDDSGHWYIIPKEKSKEFSSDLEKFEKDYEFDFDGKWGLYRTGGDLNLIQLYADLK